MTSSKRHTWLLKYTRDDQTMLQRIEGDKGSVEDGVYRFYSNGVKVFECTEQELQAITLL
jgi:hypothetical protein